MRWSLIIIASESPRLFSSRAVVSASSPDPALMTVYVLAVPGAQVAPHRREDLWIVVHDEKDGLVHAAAFGALGSAIGSVTRNSVRPGCDSTEISPSL